MNNSRWKIEFDWTEFDEEALEEVKYFENEVEDSVYGFLPFVINGREYIADIHYYNHGGDDYGFYFDVWVSNEHGAHYLWLTELKGIKSATHYKRFCRRAEDLIIDYFRKQAEETAYVSDTEETREDDRLPKRDMETLMHLSTAHITPETFEWLLKVCYTDKLLCPFMVYEKTWTTKTGRITTKETTGFFIHLFDPYELDLDEYEELPEDLKMVFRTAMKEEANWLVLDHDAPQASDYHWSAGKNLPVYEWSTENN